jgi:hypothetical protein
MLVSSVGTYSKGELFDTLCTLLLKHPNYTQWKYNVPVGFKIINKKNIQLHVLFEGTTGYRIVSWVQCCGIKRTKDPLASAMRYSVRRQINQYKKLHLDKICILCNSTVKIEVDHYPTKFADIKKTFLLDNVVPEQFNYHPKRGNYMFHRRDKVFNRKWQLYHKKHASYRYLCSKCNKIV